jgi:hypothetical protein
MKVLTHFVNPPIPDRRWDWAAWIEGDEESLSARGPTEQAAIEALRALILENAIEHTYGDEA